MDKQKAKILHDLLKSSSTDKTCRGLREIKKRLLTSPNNLPVFRTLGLIPQTLKLIQRPNEDILNGALSILSSCCLDEDGRREVFTAGGVTHLLNVLKCAKLEPLQLRACRTLANQAQHKPSCTMLVRLRAVELVMEVLEGCQEEETKVAGIRALRLFANCGEHCQKIVTCKGILRICSAGFGAPGSTTTPSLARATLKAIAHFSRISHPSCISQIMEGTDNMILVSKMWDSADQETYECVLRTILNTVHSCFVPSPQHKRDVLDAKVLDRLCTATAPSIIVAELQNRRVASIEEEKLILALCKFCEGSSECNNLTFGSFSEPPTFLGRAWMQLIDCGGVALLVSLLLAHRNHPKLRPALLRAILGVEHNYSYRDTILKHLLAAKLLPQLAEQFDELMIKYTEVRRDPQPGKCIHTIKTGDEEAVSGGEGEGGGEKERGKGGDSGKEDGGSGGEGRIEESGRGTEMGKTQEEDDNLNKMEVEEEEEVKEEVEVEENTQSKEEERRKKTCDPKLTPVGPPHIHKDTGEDKKDACTKLHQINHPSSHPTNPLPASPEIIFGNQPNLTTGSHPNPRSPDSVSCSPRSYQSSSGHGSPSWSPPVAGGENSAPGSPPFVGSFVSPFPASLPPWGVETVHTSPRSPTSSPPLSPTVSSPLRSTSPIRVPSDWEYEEEEERDAEDDGRFSPTVLESKLSELEESQEEEEEEEEEESMSVEEDVEGGQESREKKEEEEVAVSSLQITADMTAMENSLNTALSNSIDLDAAPLSISTAKRGRETPSATTTITSTSAETPQEKKIKLNEDAGEGTEVVEVMNDTPSHKPPERSEVEAGGLDGKSPFVKLNQIKFRVRKKGPPRRQISLGLGDGIRPGTYTPIQEQPKSETSGEGRPTQQEPHNQQQEPGRRASGGRGRSESVCSSTVLVEASKEEAQCLELLELVVRVIGQVAHVKEAIKPVCREFVPRIVTYLSKAQVIHRSATRMLVTIARNTQCIQPLLDSLFIPYVGVELGEAGDPESPSGCYQCKILSEGSSAFLDQMVNFFNHIHQYGQCEVSSRLNPSRELGIREGCVMALPHIIRCPKLLHDFMVGYPAIDLLMTVLHSALPPDQANYMYATAALSRLASTLLLENQYKPVRCEVCYRRESHSKEEVTAQLKSKDMRCAQSTATHASTGPTPTHTSPHTHTSAAKEDGQECHIVKDEAQDIMFKLKDGSTVSANRESLADKNEVLRGMLLGSFSEGSSSSVELPWSSKRSVEMLIHFLHGCRQCSCMESGRMEANMELVLMSQMYLVEGLQGYAEARMIASISEWEDVIHIYESGVGRINENLILQAICLVLVKPMKTWKRARWIKGLFQSPHAEDIDHNIRMILHHPLDINRLVCNCNKALSLYMVSESEYRKLC